jgi:hypothetical protein
MFSELSAEDRARLEQQRNLVLAVIKQRYGTPTLTGSKADLPVLQRLLDEKVFAKTQTYELQSLGVVFGDVLASEFQMRWIIVTDEFGTGPTLRFMDTTLQINALTIVSKRVERDEEVDLAQFLRIIGPDLAEFKRRADK